MGIKKQRVVRIICRHIIITNFLCFFCIHTVSAQDSRNGIKEYLDFEIEIEDSFAGQSMTLIKEDSIYFILRKIYGSGKPILSTIKYKTEVVSKYQIQFSEIAESSEIPPALKKEEHYTLNVEEDGLQLYLNGMKILLRK